MVHNPEFLTARRAVSDFREQSHIVIGGKQSNSTNVEYLSNFYKTFWPIAIISIFRSSITASNTL